MTKAKLKKIHDITQLDDQELVERFSKKSCELSFIELTERYKTKAYNLCMHLTKNKEDAEEVLQDVFATVYRKIDSFEGQSKFSSWLFRITVNAAYMKLRKRKQDRTVSWEDMLPTISNQALNDNAYGARTDDFAINNQIRVALQDALLKIPEEYRAVFILRDIDGLPNKDVGEILNLSIPAVKSRLHRSRTMLKKRLKRFYEDYSAGSIKEFRKAA